MFNDQTGVSVKRNKLIAYYAMGIALYVVLSMTIKIPLINHIKTDFGYVAFGAFLNLFGMSATIVGVIGCVLSNVLSGGSFPIGWIIGQIFIGIACGYYYKNTDKMWLTIIVTIISVFIGIAVIKTMVEVIFFNLPLEAKIIRSVIAFIADAIPMVIGLLISTKIHLKED